MTENKTSDRIQKWSQLWYESREMMVKSAFEIQDLSAQYAQKRLVDGIETLKSNIEASRDSMQMGNTPIDQQEGMQSRMNGGLETYKRNAAFLQRTTEQGAETFRANAESMRDLALNLMKKAQQQQEIFF